MRAGEALVVNGLVGRFGEDVVVVGGANVDVVGDASLDVELMVVVVVVDEDEACVVRVSERPRGWLMVDEICESNLIVLAS